MKNIYYLIVISCTLFYSSLNAQWVQTNFPYSGTVNCLADGPNGVGGKNLFAGTEGGGVYLSTDDGTSWQAANNGLGGSVAVRSIVISGLNVLAMTEGGIYYSTNSGSSWQAAAPISTELKCIAIKDSNFFAGTYDPNGGGEVYRSTNNGTSWEIVYLTLMYRWVSSLIISDSNIFAGTHGGLQGYIAQSSDNGTTWIRDTTYGGGDVIALGVIGTNTFAGTEGGGVYLSTDNGLSWNEANTGLPANIQVLCFAVSGADIFAGTGGSGTYLSTNYGTIWTEANKGLTNANVVSMVVSETNLFAAISGSGLWRRPLSELITAVADQSNEIPTGFVLEQNYPNPFNPSTAIRFQVPNASFVNLKVYDVLGKEVATLVNEEKPVGNYEVNFNPSNLASGIYFYTLQAGKFTETKKLILLK
ncbi:MAG TPA: T9SS type A sorting domain-containing protein [Ignavibacteriaceae bacterium]|nr:T9SS type A sorting domain-containing protein [Ignavibacteriaceae bacterium]